MSSSWRDNGRGYLKAYMPEHPNADAKGNVYQHVAVASRAMGRPLPDGAMIHHVNGDTKDNRPANLVVCPDMAYHKLLHVREKALNACGNPDAIKCWICGEWGAPSDDDMYVRPNRPSGHHRSCVNEYHMDRYEHKTDVRRLSPDCVKAVEADLDAGLHREKIAEKHGIHVNTVTQVKYGRHTFSNREFVAPGEA